MILLMNTILLLSMYINADEGEDGGAGRRMKNEQRAWNR